MDDPEHPALEASSTQERATAAAAFRGSGNGLFAANRVYTHDVLGTGTQATFGFDVYDSFPTNDVGGLCVSVFEDDLGLVVSDVTVAPRWSRRGRR